jgi:hypothetical protein
MGIVASSLGQALALNDLCVDLVAVRTTKARIESSKHNLPIAAKLGDVANLLGQFREFAPVLSTPAENSPLYRLKIPHP